MNTHTFILVILTILFATFYVEHPSAIRAYPRSGALKKKHLKSKEEKPVCGKVVGLQELNHLLGEYNFPPYVVFETPGYRKRHPDHTTGEIQRDRRSTERKRVKLKFARDLRDDVLNREKKDLRGLIDPNLSVRTTTPLPWVCQEENRPIDLADDYYPDEIDNVVCPQTSCWYGRFLCRAKTMNVTVFKLRNCIPPANSPKSLRKVWDVETKTVNVSCVCADPSPKHFIVD